MSEAMDLEKISKSVAPKAAGRDPSEYTGVPPFLLKALWGKPMALALICPRKYRLQALTFLG